MASVASVAPLGATSEVDGAGAATDGSSRAAPSGRSGAMPAARGASTVGDAAGARSGSVGGGGGGAARSAGGGGGGAARSADGGGDGAARSGGEGGHGAARSGGGAGGADEGSAAARGSGAGGEEAAGGRERSSPSMESSRPCSARTSAARSATMRRSRSRIWLLTPAPEAAEALLDQRLRLRDRIIDQLMRLRPRVREHALHIVAFSVRGGAATTAGHAVRSWVAPSPRAVGTRIASLPYWQPPRAARGSPATAIRSWPTARSTDATCPSIAAGH